MDAPPQMPESGLPDERRLNVGERFLLWAGILMPGLISPLAMLLWFGVGYGTVAGYQVWLVLIPVAWLGLLLGCCYLSGWILAAKRGPDGRTSRAIKPAAYFLLGQVAIVPVIGFGTCFGIVQLNF